MKSGIPRLLTAYEDFVLVRSKEPEAKSQNPFWLLPSGFSFPAASERDTKATILVWVTNAGFIRSEGR